MKYTYSRRSLAFSCSWEREQGWQWRQQCPYKWDLPRPMHAQSPRASSELGVGSSPAAGAGPCGLHPGPH